MKGLAKRRLSLTALSARLYSRARSKGCSAGSTFLNTRGTSRLVDRSYSFDDRETTLTFIVAEVRSPPHATSC